MLRKCKGCGLEAHTEEDLQLFTTNSKSAHGKRNECKKCSTIKSMKHQKDNYGKTQATRRRHNYKRYYGVTPEWYENKLAEQNNECEICEIHVDDYGKRFNIDHNHTTGEARGLLCHACNVLLGHSREDITILKKTIKYIKEYN